jgi:glycosyltransferase involved in cell wall biosynthesis
MYLPCPALTANTGGTTMPQSVRIGMLAPISWRVPPRHYGPWERITSILTEGLVARGFDVTLFATADSITTARLHAEAPRPYSEDPTLDAKVYEGLHSAAAFERAAQFDLLHNHFDFMPLTYSRLVNTPVVATVHGLYPEQVVKVYQAYNDIVHLVAISDANRHPDLTYAATIHHGIPLDDLTFRAESDDYLLFFGRIHPDKGAYEAIELARRTGYKLLLAGIVADDAYFRTSVEPYLDDTRICYIGSVEPAERDILLGGATALIHLIGFEEPFGLSVVEAMATGTPVIAYPKGSMPEIIDDKKTGFLVEDMDSAVRAVQHLADLDRRACRAHVEHWFSADRMVDDYVRLYRHILGNSLTTRTRLPGSGRPQV